MILQVQLDSNEEFTNIGFAKAIIDASHFTGADLEEIAKHLLLVVKCKQIYAGMVKKERMARENELL